MVQGPFGKGCAKTKFKGFLKKANKKRSPFWSSACGEIEDQGFTEKSS